MNPGKHHGAGSRRHRGVGVKAVRIASSFGIPPWGRQTCQFPPPFRPVLHDRFPLQPRPGAASSRGRETTQHDPPEPVPSLCRASGRSRPDHARGSRCAVVGKEFGVNDSGSSVGIRCRRIYPGQRSWLRSESWLSNSPTFAHVLRGSFRYLSDPCATKCRSRCWATFT